MHYDPLNENISIVKVSVYLKPLFIDDVFLLHLINLHCIHCVMCIQGASRNTPTNPLY